MKSLFILVLLAAGFGSPVVADPSGDAIAGLLQKFNNDCSRLESMSKDGLRQIIELDQSGYFPYFCMTKKSEKCATFNRPVAGYGILAQGPGNHCYFQHGVGTSSLVGH